jgi:hypothetical protein
MPSRLRRPKASFWRGCCISADRFPIRRSHSRISRTHAVGPRPANDDGDHRIVCRAGACCAELEPWRRLAAGPRLIWKTARRSFFARPTEDRPSGGPTSDYNAPPQTILQKVMELRIRKGGNLETGKPRPGIQFTLQKGTKNTKAGEDGTLPISAQFSPFSPVKSHGFEIVASP